MRIAVAHLPAPPDPRPRPKWALFLWERGLTPDDVVPVVGKSREHIRKLGLPWSDPVRIEPSDEEKARIAEWTGGEVGADDWRPPAELQLTELREKVA